MTKRTYHPGEPVKFEMTRGSGIEGTGQGTIVRRAERHPYGGYKYEIQFTIDGKPQATTLVVSDFNLHPCVE